MIIRSLTGLEVREYASRLLSLQHDAYASEAALIEDDRIPPLHETERDLVSARILWFATCDADLIVGALGYTISNGEVSIDRLMIHPSYHRRGLGRALVATVVSLADRAFVSTGMRNTPARKLYESLGFSHDADIEPVPGLWVSQYSWKPGL